MRKYSLLLLLSIVCNCPLLAQDSLLQRSLDAMDYFKLRDVLNSAQNNLSPDARLYYTAIVDNAFNKNELAIMRADSFKKLRTDKWTAGQTIRLNEMLLDSYFKTYHYREAAATAEVLKHQYTTEDIGALQNMQYICNGLANVPPQTVSMADATILQIERNRMNLLEIPITVDASDEKFLFDTGANISTISAGYATRLNLKRIPVPIKVNGGQGKRVDAELGVADNLQIGNMTFHNVVFLVMPDETLTFSKIDFRINGIIGFPVISAMQEVHISKKGLLTVPVKPSYSGSHNMALNGFTPLVQVRTDNDTVIFQFDTGAVTSNLFSKYLDEHREQVMANSDRGRRKVGSVGGNANMKVYELNLLNLYIGDAKATLTDVIVYRDALFGRSNTIASGNMGQDVINQFSELSINFNTMSLSFK